MPAAGTISVPAGAVRRSVLKRAALALFALCGVAMLVGLGIWQLERRIWKLDLIERVDARVHAAPVPAPGPAMWPRIKAEEYRHVRVTGNFLGGSDTLVRAVTEQGGGYWVLSAFRANDGFTVLVNRGFVPEDRARNYERPARTETALTGLLRLSEPGGAFLRRNDPAEGRWYSRDVDAIAAARGLFNIAPYFIDADASEAGERAPAGGLTVISFPNNHLVYALTWLLLALMLFGWLVYFIRSERRGGPDFR